MIICFPVSTSTQLRISDKSSDNLLIHRTNELTFRQKIFGFSISDPLRRAFDYLQVDGLNTNYRTKSDDQTW